MHCLTLPLRAGMHWVQNRDVLAKEITLSQAQASQKLSQELMRPGNILTALDGARYQPKLMEKFLRK